MLNYAAFYYIIYLRICVLYFFYVGLLNLQVKKSTQILSGINTITHENSKIIFL